jgi:hypothetical protein
MRNPITSALTAAAAVSLLALSGCNQLDPLQRPYMWKEQNVNQQNIAAMAVNPGDLIHGQDASGRFRPARMETDAVTHVWSGATPSLLGGGSGGGSSGGGASGGGASSSGSGGS